MDTPRSTRQRWVIRDWRATGRRYLAVDADGVRALSC